MKKFSWAFFGLGMLAVILAAVTCAVNPVSGKKELIKLVK
jgi:hypothetical protein